MSTVSTEIEKTGENLHLATTDIQFKTILVATDFSKPAEQALKTAIAISQAFGSELILVHAALPFYYGADLGMLPTDVLDVNLDVAREKMEALVASDPALQALHPTTAVEYGDALEIINQTAYDENVDLIVVGSHGASGVERLAIGSVAECILRNATCPVLIAGPNCRAEGSPFRAMLFATDLTPSGLRAAQYASSLAERFHSKLTMLHVIETRERIPGVEPELIADRVKEDLRRLLPADAEQQCKTNVRVEYGNAAEVILDVARQECSSLVIVGLRQRGVLSDHAPWSTLSHLTHGLNCALLGVRAHLK